MLDIPGYELLEKIGDGGMSIVWKARQLSLDRLVAIKVLSQNSLPDQEARDRFRLEARNTARLNHPNIVQIFDTGESGGAAYLVMEYVHGHTVGDEIAQQITIAEDRALEIAEQVARALAYAWEKECLIHCDIKPDNILVDAASGVTKVADLGLARMISLSPHRDDHLIIGTPNYTSPEQSAGVPDLDCRTDMYALGATLYHMVTGVLPFRGAAGSEAMNRHEHDFLEDPAVINPSLSPATAWLIEKLMIKNRALRPHFWTQTLKDIQAVRRGDLPYDPLPEAGASTVLRAPGRTAERATKTSAGVRKPGEAPRLVIKKSTPLSAALATPPARKSSGGGAGRFFFFFLLLAAVIAGGLVYKGYLTIPWFGMPEPEPPEAIIANAGEPAEPEVAPRPAVTRPQAWQNGDFIAGARLFNQALADYTQFQQTRENPSILADIEAACRSAIHHFEACRDEAPPHIDIDGYITQCNGLIFNVRQSSTLTAGENGAPSTAKAAAAPRPDIVIEMLDDAPLAAPPSSVARSQVQFVDDLLPETPAPAPAEEDHRELLRLAFGPAWSQAPPDAGGIADEFHGLLMRHATPSRELMLDASISVYPGIQCMMSAAEAARVLKQPLPVRRPVTTPGFPGGSLYGYTFEGDFAGARQLTLVVDRNDRIVMSRLYDDRPAPARMEEALFSPRWSVVDFVDGRRRAETDGLIAHRVRTVANTIRLNTEVAATEPANGERISTARAQLIMPRELAGLILQVGK